MKAMKRLLLLLLLALFVGGTATPVFNFLGFGPATAYGQDDDDQGEDDDDQGEDNDDQ